MNRIAPDWIVRSLVAIGTLVLVQGGVQGASAQEVCDNGSDPQGVAVLLNGLPSTPEGPIRFAGLTLNSGIGPLPGQNEVVFGLKLPRRKGINAFRGKVLEVPCRTPNLLDGPRAELHGGICWAVLKYSAGKPSCWHLLVDGDPVPPPFRVYIDREARGSRTGGAAAGWNVERDLPKAKYIRVKVHPPEKPPKDDKDQEPPLFETNPEELSEGKVPRTLDCRELLNRIVQWQLTCDPPCSSEIVDSYLKPYLGDPPDARGKSTSSLRVENAVRRPWLETAMNAWSKESAAAECLLPLKSLTFKSAE